MHDLESTLVAIATPPGRGGIGSVRLSGSAAARIARLLFRSNASAPKVAGGLEFGRFIARDGGVIDHGYLVLFEPRSAFTGELTAELWTHGSPAVQLELVAAALQAGAQAAGPGEFTYRALRNGRLDLARAEAVRDLIAARTVLQARTALAQVEGGLSRRLHPLRETLADLIARAEAAVEFVDEAETHLADGALDVGIADLRGRLALLLIGFHAGRLVREGATLVITGAPNVGKSSLFNRLLERDRAIVTSIPGTTRDVLEESIELGGIPVRLLDTAGIRESSDPVESEGVNRAKLARGEADLVLRVFDAAQGASPAESEPRSEAGPNEILVMNKVDLVAGPRAETSSEAVWVSALSGQGMDQLRERLRVRLLAAGPLESPLLTNARHAAALEEAVHALDRAIELRQSGLSEEILLLELHQAMDRIGSITGAFTTEDLLDRVFSTFCIGK